MPRWFYGLVALNTLVGCTSAPHQAPQAAAATAPAPAPEIPAAPNDSTPPHFADWLSGFRAQARLAGIDESTLKRALDGVHYLPRVVEQDRSQPEFTRAIWDYVESIASPTRVSRGLEKLQQWRTPALAAQARFGVPAPVLMAVWGMESNYGSHYGNLPVIDALATLAFDGRREAWARSELLAALRIVQRGDMTRTQMLGSWAGAMGQTQFIPSIYLAHGVDADEDGRVDIWGSIPDVLASTAHFIARSGWQANEPWGVEVTVPAGFDWIRADPSVRQSSDQWTQEGLRSPDGSTLPPVADASLLLPAGARGPAFLVGANYRALLRYNNANSYALAVGLLSQRLGGGPSLHTPWPRDLRPLTRSEVSALQTALNQRGFQSGAVDGRAGAATRKAVQLFQRSQGLPADGYATVELLQLVVGAP